MYIYVFKMYVYIYTYLRINDNRKQKGEFLIVHNFQRQTKNCIRTLVTY